MDWISLPFPAFHQGKKIEMIESFKETKGPSLLPSPKNQRDHRFVFIPNRIKSKPGADGKAKKKTIFGKSNMEKSNTNKKGIAG